MKKVFTIALMSLALFSCSNEEPVNTNVQNVQQFEMREGNEFPAAGEDVTIIKDKYGDNYAQSIKITITCSQVGVDYNGMYYSWGCGVDSSGRMWTYTLTKHPMGDTCYGYLHPKCNC